MDQYFYAVNIDKKQYLHPHRCGDGLTLFEVGASGNGTMMCLAVLLADGERAPELSDVFGAWAGDRIVVAGDYADVGKFVAEADCASKKNLHNAAADGYEDISRKVLRALCNVGWLAESLRRKTIPGSRQSLYDYMAIS